MTDMPSIRFSAKPAVSKKIGIAYCGPFQVFSGKKPHRDTFALSPAVHLAATDVSTEKCLPAINRFCSRR